MGPLSGATDAYGYNGRNEVVSARRTLGGESVAGFDEDFAYDPIGNRISATDYDETGAARISTYAANNLNQYTARTVPGWASVRGLADADATVAVNGNAAYMVGRAVPSAPNPDDLAYFFGSDDFDNSAAGGFAELEVSAVVSDGINDFVSVATNRVFVPPANETYAYDADGNMMEDARFRYYWNGENRMIRAEEKSAPSGRQPYVIAYAYDHMGRNVIKDGAKFIWDDYNIIVEDAASSNATFNTWGLDIDGTMQGAGGVGGLLAVEKGDAAYLPDYDANGNVTEYVTVDGSVTAHYAYSAFGRQLLAEDEIGFTHRFSTKPYCAKTGLAEFELRGFSSWIGRWVCRDVVEEFGGLNLWGYGDNRAIDITDLLGLKRCSTIIYAGHSYSASKYLKERKKKVGKNLPCGDRLGVVSCERDRLNKKVDELFPEHSIPGIPRKPGTVLFDNVPNPNGLDTATKALQDAWNAAVEEAKNQCKDNCCESVMISVKCDKAMSDLMHSLKSDWCTKKEEIQCPRAQK